MEQPLQSFIQLCNKLNAPLNACDFPLPSIAGIAVVYIRHSMNGPV